MKISRILSTKGSDVIAVRQDQQVRAAVAVLVARNIGAVVVLDDAGQLVGILSERDIIRRAAADERVFDLNVSEIMTRNVISCLPQDEIMSVANTMTERRFRHMPVMDGGRLVGVISIGDVLKAQRDQYRGEIDTLETQIMADD
jgi:CBS domain-containing protein